MAVGRQLVVNRDGYVVDLETGVVVDESPLCYDASCELPPGLDRGRLERRLRVAPLESEGSGGSGLRMLGVKVPVRLVEMLDLVVEAYGWPSRSALVREVLERFLASPSGPVGRELWRRLRDLYAARGFLYAARSLLAMARAYAPDEILRDDVRRVEEELEAAIEHFDEALADANRKLGLW